MENLEIVMSIILIFVIGIGFGAIFDAIYENARFEIVNRDRQTICAAIISGQILINLSSDVRFWCQ